MVEFKFDMNAKNEGFLNLFAEGKKMGFMDIKIKEGKLTVFHTEVFPEGQGKGYAGKLLTQIVAYARENGLKIVPLCSYVLSRFQKSPDTYADVWFKD